MSSHINGGASPIHRLRAQVRDTNPDDWIFEDDEYRCWLELSEAPRFLSIYYPSADATTATAQVKVVGAELKLQLNIDGSDSTPITLAKPAGLRTADLIDSIRDLDEGWKVGLGDYCGVDWIDITTASWRDYQPRSQLKDLRDLARVANLAVHWGGSSAAVNALGDEDTFARLRYYNISYALLLALRALEGKLDDEHSMSERREGDASWTRVGIAERMKNVEHQASFGIYGLAA